jgi:hypothetical protein
LCQSGPLTGQQYSIRRQYALRKAHGNGIKSAIAPQVPQPQKLNRTTWERYRTSSVVAPEHRRPATVRASRARGGKSLRPLVRQVENLGRSTPFSLEWVAQRPPPPAHTGIASPDTRRRLPVAPLIGYQRCYGESPASVRRGCGAARGMVWCRVAGIGRFLGEPGLLCPSTITVPYEGRKIPIARSVWTAGYSPAFEQDTKAGEYPALQTLRADMNPAPLRIRHSICDREYLVSRGRRDAESRPITGGGVQSGT